jgi:hypothetical protein
MNEIILNTSTLPEPLSRMIRSERVKAREAGGEIRLTPITDVKEGCPLRGLCSDGQLSSYSFMERKQVEKELEG